MTDDYADSSDEILPGITRSYLISEIMAGQEYIENLLEEWPNHLEVHNGSHETVVASLVVQLAMREKIHESDMAAWFAISVGMLYRERQRRLSDDA